MGAQRGRAHGEGLSQRFGGHSVRRQLEDLDLTPGQAAGPLLRGRRFRPPVTEPPQQVPPLLRPHQGVAPGHGPDRFGQLAHGSGLRHVPGRSRFDRPSHREVVPLREGDEYRTRGRLGHPPDGLDRLVLGKPEVDHRHIGGHLERQDHGRPGVGRRRRHLEVPFRTEGPLKGLGGEAL